MRRATTCPGCAVGVRKVLNFIIMVFQTHLRGRMVLFAYLRSGDPLQARGTSTGSIGTPNLGGAIVASLPE